MLPFYIAKKDIKGEFIMKKAILTIIILALVLSIGCSFNIDNNSETKLTNSKIKEEIKLHFLDVGQADSIIIELYNNKVILIDGGNRSDSDKILSYMDELSIEKIDILIATHPHEDHIGGLPDIIRDKKVKKVYMPKVTTNTKIYEELLDEIIKNNIETFEPIPGQDIFNMKNISFKILSPDPNKKHDELNEYSIITKLSYKDFDALFTGDAEKDSEEYISKSMYNLESDILKVGHHGGKTSSNKFFLDKVKPKVAVISVGENNDYGHPNNEVIDRLKKHDTKIYRTDIHGNIIITSDGKNISIKTQKNNIQETKNISNSKVENKKYIGNKNSKIIHKHNANHLPIEKNRILFGEIDKAIKKGYKKCKICFE